MRLEKETFGPVLRAARERRGVSLRQLAEETKLSIELWEGLEENNLERWPKRILCVLPPAALAINWLPRQMPKIGSPGSSIKRRTVRTA